MLKGVSFNWKFLSKSTRALLTRSILWEETGVQVKKKNQTYVCKQFIGFSPKGGQTNTRISNTFNFLTSKQHRRSGYMRRKGSRTIIGASSLKLSKI